MNIAERIGAIYRMGAQLSPLLLFVSGLTNFAMFAMLREKPVVVQTPVIAYDAGAAAEGKAPLRLECETGTQGRQLEAIEVANKIMKVLYEYQKGNKKEYIARYKEIFSYIKTDSPAERVIRQIAEQRSRMLETSSGTFTLDYKMTKAKSVGKTMYVAVVGTWESQTVKGPEPKPIKLDLTFDIGDNNASFILRDIADRQ